MPYKNSKDDQNRYLTLPQAAKALGIPVSTLRRAANAGLIKSYAPFSTRKRVILREDAKGAHPECEAFRILPRTAARHGHP